MNGSHTRNITTLVRRFNRAHSARTRVLILQKMNDILQNMGRPLRVYAYDTDQMAVYYNARAKPDADSMRGIPAAIMFSASYVEAIFLDGTAKVLKNKRESRVLNGDAGDRFPRSTEIRFHEERLRAKPALEKR